METDKQEVIKNLEDAGCKDCEIECLIECLIKGNKDKGLALLTKHRKKLLDSIHAEQKRLDCLDYLIYQIEHKL